MEPDASTTTRLRHTVTHRVPISVRRLPYRVADRAVGVVDDIRLRRALPNVAEAIAGIGIDRELHAVHDRYVTEISNWEWAVAWKTALLLDALCTELRPRRILDLGSGFSTFVECNWARRTASAVEIVSVDDSVEWLDTTRAFLAGEGLEATLVEAADLDSLPDASFDLAFDDMGRIEHRAQVVDTLTRVMAPGAVVILDDMNVRGYRGQVKAKLDRAGWPLYSLRNETFDAKGRFAMLTTVPKP